jgi:hypothetical protein
MGDEVFERLNGGLETKRGDQAHPVSVRRTENRARTLLQRQR